MRGGGEHLKDLEFRRPKSHLLRHCVEIHPDTSPNKVEFRMKILSTHRSAFERQLREAVVLDYYAGPQIMNSRMEYTRCGIPKLEMKIGNKEVKENKEVMKEKEIIEKIKLLYKGENKRAKIDDENGLDETMKMTKKRRKEVIGDVEETTSTDGTSGQVQVSDMNPMNSGPKMCIKGLKSDAKNDVTVEISDNSPNNFSDIIDISGDKVKLGELSNDEKLPIKRPMGVKFGPNHSVNSI